MEPRTITLSVTFRVGSRPVLGSAGGPYQVWATADRARGGHYELTIGDVGNPTMAALARHSARRLYAQADLAEFREALFGRLAELLERPVFACCDRAQPDRGATLGRPAPAGCLSCGAELDADQVRALVECEHPAVADEPAGERSPCPDCGLVWCQAVAAANVQYHEVRGMTLASYDGAAPCERPATRARQDGMTVCTAHQAGDEILGVRPTRR